MKLFTEFTIKDMTLKNRIVLPPMCMYSASQEGLVNDFHLNHYSTRALGGVGLIIIESTAVNPNGRITINDLGIWTQGQVEGLRILCQKVQSNGSKIGIQLQHAGRKSQVDVSRMIAPSPIAFSQDFKTPDEMSQRDITELVYQYGKATERALEAGFDFVEVHAAHGYLLHEFLSPITNKRDDEYGGSLENRGRLLAQVITEVRKYWPSHKPLGIRVSAIDYDEGGLTPEDLVKIINIVKVCGVDIVNVSTGGLTPTAPPAYPGYQLDAAKTVKSGTSLPVMGGGLITEPEMAEDAIVSQKADLIYVGREILRNPFWPLLSSNSGGIDIPWPSQYERANPRKV